MILTVFYISFIFNLSWSEADSISVLDLKNPKNYRGNFCSYVEAFTHGSSSQAQLSLALSGEEISIGINTLQQMDPFFLTVNASGYPIGGWMFEVRHTEAPFVYL